ncbi:MAG: glycerol-3-phosphate dehydrogenase/oxidase [bacterium]
MKRDLKTLSENQYDILVIGGGIYGATIAYDAALRGLSVALIDKGDFGGRTSGNSLKIIHGGLRYLQNFDIVRMRESIRERRTLMRIAPHLVHPFPCVMPTYGHLMKGKEVMRMGMLMNDIISFDRNRLSDHEKYIPRGRVLSKGECLRLVPGIDDRGVTGGAFWHDAQMINSDRLILSFVLSAVKEESHAANYVEAVGFNQQNGRIEGIEAKDVLTGEPFPIRSRLVINAGGGWMDKVLGLADGRLRTGHANLSTAMNLVIKREILPGCAAGLTSRMLYKRSDGKVVQKKRVLFMAPWRRFTLVGTFHRPYSDDPDALHVTEEEVERCLKEANSAYPGAPIQREDVSFFHKGFLPMDGTDRKWNEVRLTKRYRIYDHSQEDGVEGLITVSGVKYTTARDVAEKVVNLAFKKMGMNSTRCTSDERRLVGGEMDGFEPFLNRATENAPYRLKADVLRRLVINYGSEYGRVLEYAKEDSNWIQTIPGSSEVLKAEIVHAVREEMALRLSDVILRRTDLGSGGHPGGIALKETATVMAEELNWSKDRVRKEIDEVNAIYRPVS